LFNLLVEKQSRGAISLMGREEEEKALEPSEFHPW
jgi:hypothetical protein